MFLYKIVFISVSKTALSQAIYAVQNALDSNYACARYLHKNFTYVPLIEVASSSFRKIVRKPAYAKRFSVIKSPFVFKKSGETFLFKSYHSYITLKIRSRLPLHSYKARCLLRFLLRNRNVSLLFKGVEIRVVSIIKL